jgi:hypothetical protein
VTWRRPLKPTLPLAFTVVFGALALGLPATAAAPTHKAQAARSVQPRDILRGDPLRRVLLDALRPSIERDLAQPVQFVVKTLRKQSGWAFVVATAQAKSGAPIDFRRTRYAEALREGAFDGGTVFALLEEVGAGWRVRDFVVGPTDVAYAAWPEEFGAPSALFGLPPSD